MRRPALLLIVTLCLLAGGCEGTRSPQPTVWEPTPVTVTRGTPDAVHADTSSDGLLRYFAYVRKLQGAELAKEHDAARQLYSAARTNFNRVRYAILLSIPGASFSDDASALDALDPLLKNQNSVLYGVAFMLNGVIQEQRRAQGLQQKLDALKSLEKDLLERGGVKRK